MSQDRSELAAPYELITGDGRFSYYFITDAAVKYIVNFDNQTEDYAPYDIGNVVVYEFQFLRAQDGKEAKDPRIEATIIHAVCEALKNADNVLLYTCDSNDGRQNSRAKLFDSWFKKYATEETYKIDGQVASLDLDADKEHVSVIINKNNAKRAELEKIFNLILNEKDRGKNRMFSV